MWPRRLQPCRSLIFAVVPCVLCGMVRNENGGGKNPPPHYTPSDPFIAAKYGHVDVLKVMVERDPEIARKTDVTGRTLIHAAAEGDQPDIRGNQPAIVEYLVSKGTPVDARDDNGWTPLHRAASAGTLEAAKTLIQLGADPNARIWNHSDDHATASVLAIAAWKGHADVVKLLLKHGAPIRHGNGKKGDTALHWAARAMIDVKRENEEQEAWQTNGEIIDLLAKRLGGVDIPSGHFENHTPLEIAADMNQPGVVKHLLENYLDEIDVKDIESAMELARIRPGTISSVGDELIAGAMIKLLREAREAKLRGNDEGTCNLRGAVEASKP